jgi:hypothetical protein
MVDVTVTRDMPFAAERVAAVMFDPLHDSRWIGGAKAAEPLDGGGKLAVGSRVKRTGGFLGREFSWTTEVTEFQPARRLAMRHVAGPFTGEVIYSIDPTPQGAHVTIRNTGKASFEVPGMGMMMRASVAKDLQRLEALVAAHHA